MTDDEAFIRAIVDAPRDDAPRLVYADWLDERGDPRGAYLRAEMEWASAAYARYRLETIHAAARGLHQTWVCRVSRPPAGVCLSHFRLEDSGPVIDSSRIVDLEKRHKLKLPVEYGLFLMNFNGGRFVPPACVAVGAGSVELCSLHSLGAFNDDVCELDQMMTLHLDPAASVRTDVYDFGMEVMFAFALGDGRHLIPIGMCQNEEDNLFIGIGSPYAGEVYLKQGQSLSWNRDRVIRLAGSFAEFLGTLQPCSNGRALSPSLA